ncbi:MAG: polymer-forming cytoskeletal protein [Prevotellaceae bacterium]|jgi:cytoskeletal protein CcmA (bactofilin family)|nr:polymer-forming cytoskeletal protein [Prevotellaceae bacterium]
MSKVTTVENGYNGNNPNINRISNGTTVVGTIDTNGDLRIDGRVEGNINSAGRVIIGETGFVKGDLVAKMLDVMGQFEGTIIVSETTVLKGSATVIGSLTPGKLVVEAGAKFDGTCIMTTKEAAKPAVELKNDKNDKVTENKSA